jgi:hypothetical protein
LFERPKRKVGKKLTPNKKAPEILADPGALGNCPKAVSETFEETYFAAGVVDAAAGVAVAVFFIFLTCFLALCVFATGVVAAAGAWANTNPVLPRNNTAIKATMNFFI